MFLLHFIFVLFLNPASNPLRLYIIWLAYYYFFYNELEMTDINIAITNNHIIFIMLLIVVYVTNLLNVQL